MRLYIGYLLMISLLFFQCKEGSVEDLPESSLQEIHLTVDLEDRLYQYNGEWYRWGDAFSDSNLPISVEYDFLERVFRVYHRPSIGNLDGSSIAISNEYDEVIVEPIMALYNQDWEKAEYFVGEDFHLSLIDMNDWATMTLIFK